MCLAMITVIKSCRPVSRHTAVYAASLLVFGARRDVWSVVTPTGRNFIFCLFNCRTLVGRRDGYYYRTFVARCLLRGLTANALWRLLRSLRFSFSDPRGASTCFNFSSRSIARPTLGVAALSSTIRMRLLSTRRSHSTKILSKFVYLNPLLPKKTHQVTPNFLTDGSSLYGRLVGTGNT